MRRLAALGSKFHVTGVARAVVGLARRAAGLEKEMIGAMAVTTERAQRSVVSQYCLHHRVSSLRAAGVVNPGRSKKR